MQYQLEHGDCLEVLRTLADSSVDAIVTDPPYGLSFMSKRWDYDVPGAEVWAECLRVLKPGGHLLAFAGTRTQHRMAVRIEDAGFEIRDMIAWVYGCLDEATEVATEHGIMPYHKTKIGDLVLCYDVEHGEYTYQPILEVVEYDYNDTAFSLVGDFGKQVVSRNHRVIVERGGSEMFQLAETLECEARVPVLESLPTLRQAVHDAHQGTSDPQQDVRRGLCKGSDRRGELRSDASGATQGCDDQVRGMWGECLEAGCMASQGGDSYVQPEVQRDASRCGLGHSRAHGAGELVIRVGIGAEGSDDWRVEPLVEGRPYLPESEGSVCGSANKVCALPCDDASDGSVGRLRDGAPPAGGACDQPDADAGGVRSPHQPRCDGQPAGEPDAVLHERAAQGVRAWGGHRSAVVRVVPFHYTGKVWCLRVPTGAFVAVRDGVAFPTGNSGFPKSHNGPWGGTALKPALEPITVARKPLVGTVAANVLEHGTGALNIDGCRVPVDASDDIHAKNPHTKGGFGHGNAAVYGDSAGAPAYNPSSGRWPANLIHGGGEPAALLGEAARYFYCAKANKRDRGAGNNHPTVKPTDLMAYLCRLVTPPGGLVLDPFMGSGSTGKACMREGFRFLGIEREAEYLAIARARIEHEARRHGALAAEPLPPETVAAAPAPPARHAQRPEPEPAQRGLF